YGVWANRTARVWETIGEAKTVFELAADAPTTAAQLLGEQPGLALVCDTDPTARAELGPVLVSLAGVSVGRGDDRVTVADPAAEVRLGAHGRELVFGSTALRVKKALPATCARDLKLWLRFRAEVLAGFPAAFLSGRAPIATRLLKPFVAYCPSCRTACLPVAGAVAGRLKA
ncbi:MAG TPA: hypothetical protein VGE74_02395, partial [Gemmata sp.]